MDNIIYLLFASTVLNHIYPIKRTYPPKTNLNKFNLTYSQCMRQMCPEAVAYDGNQTFLGNICISLDQSKSKNVLWENYTVLS